MRGKMNSRTDEEFIKTCQLMNRLGITFSIWGGGKSFIDGSDVPVDIIITVNHLYDVLTRKQLSVVSLMEAELSERWLAGPFERSLANSSDELNFKKASAFLTELNIPFESIIHYPAGIVDNGSVSAFDLYDIFADREKLKELVSRLKSKGF